MGRLIRRFLAMVMLAVLAANGVAGYLSYDYNRPGPLKEPKTLVFARKQGFIAMVQQMQTEGVIHQALTLEILAIGLQKAHSFKAGEYLFPPGISAHEVVDMVVSGRVVMRKVTLPEGLTVHDAIDILNKEPALTGEITGDISEGTLLPQTYLFSYGDSRQQVIKQMQDGMKKQLSQLWQARAQGLPLKTPKEALVLASIVEKETGLASERPLVASVFINRLRYPMRLQSDPTVAYGLMIKHGGPLKHTLTSDDLQTETPYNTYTIDGLPPEPIANPGKASLEAVLNPPQTGYLYFVATGNGGHNFAKSLEEHNHNVRLYREALANKKD